MRAKFGLLLLLLLMQPLGCAGLPRITAAPDAIPSMAPAACTEFFPRGRWQFAHVIQAAPPGGSRQTMIGIIRTCSAERSFHCVMMTLEGFVLFEALYDGADLHVHKAVPPLDTPGLAQGLMADLLLVFFAPQGTPDTWGALVDGARICRYPTADGGTQDILAHPDGRWEIRRYDAHQRLRRSVIADSETTSDSHGFPTRLALRAHGPTGYRLDMNLMEVIPLENDLKP